MEPGLNENKEDDDDDYYLLFEVGELYGTEMHNALSPIIKRFLADYFGEKFFNLDGNTYLEMDRILKESLNLGYEIPYILSKHRTIKDSRLWKEEFKKYKPTDTIFPFPKNTYWYDTFLDMVHDDEGEFLDCNTDCSSFLKQSNEMFFQEAHSFIKGNSSFELSILSPEGFIALQGRLDLLAEIIFIRLYGVVMNDIEKYK